MDLSHDAKTVSLFAGWKEPMSNFKSWGPVSRSRGKTLSDQELDNLYASDSRYLREFHQYVKHVLNMRWMSTCMLLSLV